MIADTISFLIQNVPAFLFVVALILATTGLPRGGDVTSRFLAWILLLPIGVTGLWAGIAHVAFPQVAAAHIGWEVSPYQFEVGMADLAIGITAFLAFWRPWEFRAAAVCAASVFLLGDAVGHIRQMMAVGNFAPGNAGVPPYGFTGPSARDCALSRRTIASRKSKADPTASPLWVTSGHLHCNRPCPLYP